MDILAQILAQILVAFVVAAITCSLIGLNRSELSSDRGRGEKTLVLPAPGPNLELYTRVKELLDAAAAERNEARTECARLKLELAEMTEQRDKIELRLRSATDVLRGWTHQRMEFNFREFDQFNKA